MSPEVRSKAFEPFFTAKPKGSGTGLGLATVYGIVNGAGGRIAIDSAPGSGTTITIDLPAVVEGGDEVTERPRAGRRQTVMVVEDEPAVLQVTSRILDRAGFHVLQARSPKAALELVRSLDQPLDVVLTDIVMPEMPGTALATKMAAIRPEARMVFMSGYTDKPEILPKGAIFIAKPFTAEALLERVEAATAR
jgi:CheY-like chemotaxis protein